MPHTMLRFPTVKARTGLSRSTIYLRISRGTFPAPVSLGGRAVGWIEAEVHAWQVGQPVVEDKRLGKVLAVAPTFVGLERLVRYCILRLMASRGLLVRDSNQ